ncbi:hypothetical protein IW140_002746 [Coemansia sp. RSA 1813]|nr:hypothetical protein EV178_003626 [Coemansia sp. RSA 1646]KAJ1769102.1 hypothetical protein LPJ74_004336 [Coemansia sp. RSA 1843]KAJ2213829.1 hypothetical protein EV179_003528 [Coemansia sp. RSA 487]KAJ2569858.1 hypothetical protein IW140_002746 [Coemansia sp. RSA 1813]
MRVSRTVCLLICLVAAFSVHCACSPLSNTIKPRLVIPNDIIKFKGAILYKNGMQTTCELALMSLSSAFVSASCLDFSSGLNLNRSTSYQVFMDNSTQGTLTIVSEVSIDDIYVHPDYNALTWENNIAVLAFNKDDSATYQTYIGMDGFNSSAQAFVRRTMDPSASGWNIPVVNYRTASDQKGDMDTCVSSSRLYMTNSDKIACTPVSTMSIFDRNCRIPFGTMYSEQGSNIIMSAIYSHTIVLASNLCSTDGNFYNYYTYLWPYVGFASKVLGQSINIFSDGKNSQYNKQDIQKMNAPSPTIVSGIRVIGGDIYTLQDVTQTPVHAGETTILASGTETDSDSEGSLSSPTPTDASVDSESSSGSSSYTSWDGTSEVVVGYPKDDGSGLSKSQKIIIGVVVPLSVILIAIGVLILYNYWKVRREDQAWDPQEQDQQLQIMALDLGGINHAHASYLASTSANEKAYNMLGLHHDPK